MFLRQPPRNVLVFKCSKTLLTWDKPAVVNEQPQNTDLKYEISINSSKGNKITFTAREEFAVVPVGTESNEIVRYIHLAILSRYSPSMIMIIIHFYNNFK